MSKAVRGAAAAIGAVLALSTIPFVSNAGTSEETIPETPKTNATLPIIHTYRGSDKIHANHLNPNPVCNPLQDLRTVVYKVKDSFLPVGTLSSSNRTCKALPWSAQTSRSQSITINVEGQKSVTAGFNAGLNKKELSFGISSAITQSLGASASYSLSWTVGQTIGPVNLDPGETGEATYGFRAITLTGTQQTCLPSGKWSAATPWIAFTPLKNEVRVKTYRNGSGALGGKNEGKPAESTDLSADYEPELNPNIGPAPSQGKKYDLDLAPRLTVSSAKAAGFAGAVALRVKNVGNQDYYGSFPNVAFLVKVRTEKGPKGVDRVIHSAGFHGAHVQDLGFDKTTSTRTFLVSLSNAIEPEEETLVATLNFGDGLTRRGRLVNSIEVSQVGRVHGDISSWNDTLLDSKKVAQNDFGKPHHGLF